MISPELPNTLAVEVRLNVGAQVNRREVHILDSHYQILSIIIRVL
jgi:hypothetical protein